MDKHIYTDHNNIYKIQRKKSNDKRGNGKTKGSVDDLKISVDS